MSGLSTVPKRPASSMRTAQIRHLSSHARLLRDASRVPAPLGRSRGRLLDAIIIPTARPASVLAYPIALAAALNIPVVVLCSEQANPDQVVERVQRVTGARGIVIEPALCPPSMPAFGTSDPAFAAAAGGRMSDLSLKRNLGLFLSRAMGWRKIVYLDDDVTVSPIGIARIAHQLENHEMVGMACRNYPDNSVFCHARRLAKLPQDVFVTGALLGVNCADSPLSFFPDVYNEDWFFFGEAAARHGLTKAGEARQKRYDPFASKKRAVNEEFGDLLAEGLYALIENLGPGYSFLDVTKYADANYWRSFITVRQEGLAEARHELGKFAGSDNCSDDVPAAVESLAAVQTWYADNLITHDLCDWFLDEWRQDGDVWTKAYMSVGILRTVKDAMEWLSPASWQAVRW